MTNEEIAKVLTNADFYATYDADRVTVHTYSDAARESLIMFTEAHDTLHAMPLGNSRPPTAFEVREI